MEFIMIKIDTGSNLIARYDNAIPPSVCNHIINSVKNQIPDDKKITEGLPWHNSDNVAFVLLKNKEIKKIVDGYRFLLTQLVYEHYKTIVYPHFTDLVIWRPGTKMGFHKDDGYEGEDQNQFRVRKFSMITYLNDDYIGGETVIKLKDSDDYVSVPKQGSVVIFKSNDECIHGVNEVTKGTRFTLATWFATDIKDCELSEGYINKLLLPN
jgi:hypothetical protein